MAALYSSTGLRCKGRGQRAEGQRAEGRSRSEASSAMIRPSPGAAHEDHPGDAVYRHRLREPVPAGVGAADRVGLEHPARVRGGVGRRGRQDDRHAPGHQRQGPEDEVPARRRRQLSHLDGEARRHGAALVVELGAHLRQAARLVAAAAAAGSSRRFRTRCWSRRSWRDRKTSSELQPLARADARLPGAGRATRSS